MQIVDAHHHLWCPQTDAPGIDYVWLKNIGAMKPFGDPTSIQRDYLPEEFRNELTQHELVGSVHLQCDGAIPDPVKESAWLEQLHQEQGLPSVHIGFLDLTSENARLTLERYLQLPGFRGIRQILSRIDNRPDISFAPEHYLHNPVWREQFGLLSEYQLSFDLQLYPEQMADAADFLAQHPDIPVVIDHAGSPYDQTNSSLQNWYQSIALLAELPHCSVKLCGFGMFDKSWTADSIQPLFDSMLSLFGVERMMFGSNFPVDKLMRNYDFLVEQLLVCGTRHSLNTEDIEKLFCHNASNFYRI